MFNFNFRVLWALKRRLKKSRTSQGKDKDKPLLGVPRTKNRHQHFGAAVPNPIDKNSH
jgi:hypothetical protein